MRSIYGVLLALVFLASCAHQPAVEDPPGRLDLSGFDFFRQGLVSLDGVWEWVPGQLLVPQEDEARLESSVPVEVPGLWGGHPFGLGTYRLHIRLAPSTPELKLYLTNLQSASVVFVNGVRLGGRGVVSPDKSTGQAEDLPYTVVVPPGQGSLDLVIHLANWTNSQGGGILGSLRLGSAVAIDRFRATNMISEVLMSGLFVFMAVFTLILYLLQRRDFSLLVFTLVALSFAARQFSIGDTLGFFLTAVPFDPILRWQESSSFLICGFLTLYFSLLFPTKGLRIPSLSLSAVGLGFAALVWLAPTEVFSATLPVTQVLVLVTILYALVQVAFAWHRREPLAPAFLVVVLFLSLPAATEAVFAELALPQLTTLGFLPFLVFQSFLLARRFSTHATEAETLRMTNTRLKELDLAKTNFLANISHELRTPITLIKAPVEAIQQGTYGTTISNAHPIFRLITNNTNRLLSLVERLLQLTKLESRERFDLQPVDYRRLVRNYFSEFESLAAQARISLTWEERPLGGPGPLVVLLDPQGFETVFFNFLSNALKITPPQGRITVCLGPSPTGQARLEVSDTGVGIEPEALKTLFVRYRKIYDGPRLGYEGHGLGLSLAREAALAMGGSVGAASQPGQGSRFWLDLPLTTKGPGADPELGHFPDYLKPPVVTVLPLGTGSDQGKQHRILVVEDNAELRQFIAQTLAAHDVVQAADGLEAIDQLGASPLPDLILCDIMMPRMGGVELFDYTRLRPTLATIPFLFLTARAEPEDQIALLNEGLAAYLVKPFSARELQAQIHSLLTLRTNQRRAMEDQVLSLFRSGSSGSGKPVYPTDATARELEVLDVLVAGKTDKEIAQLLGISTRTASNHVASLLRKTGLGSRQALRQRYQ